MPPEEDQGSVWSRQAGYLGVMTILFDLWWGRGGGEGEGREPRNLCGVRGCNPQSRKDTSKKSG